MVVGKTADRAHGPSSALFQPFVTAEKPTASSAAAVSGSCRGAAFRHSLSARGPLERPPQRPQAARNRPPLRLAGIPDRLGQRMAFERRPLLPQELLHLPRCHHGRDPPVPL